MGVYQTDFSQMIHDTEEHLHSQQLIRPHLANAITVTSHLDSWTFGALSNDLIAVATIALPFDIHWIEINPGSTADEFQLELVVGASEEIGGCSWEVVSGPAVTLSKPMQTKKQPAGTQIRAKLANAGAASSLTCTIKLKLHTYD